MTRARRRASLGSLAAGARAAPQYTWVLKSGHLNGNPLTEWGATLYTHALILAGLHASAC